jgi:hypothetical protein
MKRRFAPLRRPSGFDLRKPRFAPLFLITEFIAFFIVTTMAMTVAVIIVL